MYSLQALFGSRCWKDHGAVALLGVVVAFRVVLIQSIESHWWSTAAFQAALQTPCRDFSTYVGNCGSGKHTALLYSLRQVFITLTSREGGGGNWAPAGSWATASGVPVTRVYCAYRCIHLPQLPASPNILAQVHFVDKMVITQRSEQSKKGTTCGFGDFPLQ